MGKRTHLFIFWVDLSFYTTRSQVWFWDQRAFFNRWAGCYIFHSSPSQLREHSTFWTPPGSRRGGKAGRRRGAFRLLHCAPRQPRSAPSLCSPHCRRRCGGGAEHRHPLRGEKTLELCILLIFVNARCVLSGDLRCHVVIHQKIRRSLWLQRRTLSLCANQKGSANCDHRGSVRQFILRNF